MKKNTTIVKDINKLFPASNEKYPVCFTRDNMVMVSGESTAKEMLMGEEFDIMVVDYYNEFGGGYPTVHKRLREYLEQNGLSYEWENPGGIHVFRD